MVCSTNICKFLRQCDITKYVINIIENIRIITKTRKKIATFIKKKIASQFTSKQKNAKIII